MYSLAILVIPILRNNKPACPLLIPMLLGHYSKGAGQMEVFFILVARPCHPHMINGKKFQNWFSLIHLKALIRTWLNQLQRYQRQKVILPITGHLLFFKLVMKMLYLMLYCNFTMPYMWFNVSFILF